MVLDFGPSCNMAPSQPSSHCSKSQFDLLSYLRIQASSSVQFTSIRQRSSEVAGLLEEVGFQSTPELSFGDGGRAQMFRKTVPDDRSGNANFVCGIPLLFLERFAIAMRMCWKYAEPVPRIELNARNAIFNCIR